MNETVKTEIMQHIETMDECQLHILLGFIKRLFNFHD